MSKPIIRQFFEARYYPYYGFFDHRSELLGALFEDRKTKTRNFEHWQLGTDRVDLFDPDRTRGFFVSYKNCGFYCTDPPSDHYAKDQILKYLTLTADVLGEGIEDIQRIGFRDVRVFSTDDLETIKTTLVKNFIRSETHLFAELDASISDFTLFPIIFRQGNNRFQITLGPATKDELAALTGNAPDMPDSALYFDIDYYALKPKLGTSLRVYVSDFLNKAENVHHKITTELDSLGLLR